MIAVVLSILLPHFCKKITFTTEMEESYAPKSIRESVMAQVFFYLTEISFYKAAREPGYIE